MWIIAKYEKLKKDLFKKELFKKLSEDIIFYNPKIKKTCCSSKKKDNPPEINLLGDYIFCFSKNFEKKEIINKIKFTIGLKYVLDGYTENQREINNFIYNCKKYETKEGFLTSDFFNIKNNKDYKFTDGPFKDFIFKVIEIQKNRLRVLMGNKQAIVRRSLLFSSL